MPVDPYAVLQALLRAEASRAQRADRAAPEPATRTAATRTPGTRTSAPAPEPRPSREEPGR
ncbi:hypothetical protein [Streptomyces sp. NPDC093089]|uniref:hypothetical protein n=1 Tax=Streptomyces sp. NPDC093089 TaxID=3366024 RepID=UPI00380F9E3F